MNLIVLKGNLTRDPETRGPDGTIVGFGMAVNTRFGGKEETLFMDVTAFGKLGELCSQYLTKGRSVLVTGRLKSRKHDDKTYFEVIANEVEFIGSGEKGDEAASDKPKTAKAGKAKAATVPAEEDDGDLPF